MNQVCPVELLTHAVSNTLSQEEETALQQHLERCDACCAKLEQLAGGLAWQNEAAFLLTSDELDVSIREPALWSETDFSVEQLDPSDDANALGQLGGYDVLGVIGRGGMGVVLKAYDRELKRLVAIKALSPHLAHSSVARKRFAREAQAAAAVVNPHVIDIHHVQPSGRLPFLIMPLLTGESLAQRLKARGPLELTEVLRIGMQAAAGLAAAHGQGLVHRDVKPANIFLEKGVERVVITDFGLARAADDVSMTRQGVLAGTPEYMSPEQACGESLDGRSDLFSLGCVLYEMATGRSPFRTDSTLATLRRIVDEQPPAMASLVPELPPWFNQIVERLLAKNPAQRFDSANEVKQLLEECLSHLQQPNSVSLPASILPLPIQPASILHKAAAAGSRWKIKPIHRGIIAMTGAIGTLLLGLFLWQATEATDISGRWTGEEWGTITLDAKETGSHSVNSQLDGEVSEVHVENDQVVKKGELLLTLRDTDLDAQVEALRHKAIEAKKSQKKLQQDRSRAAQDGKSEEVIRSEKEIKETDRYRELLLRIEAEQGMRQTKLDVRSPIDGVVSMIKAKQGQPVSRGQRLLEVKGPWQYEGTFAGTDNRKPGSLNLNWSRIERRFKGTWKTEDDRTGQLSLRLVGNEIRGAWTIENNADLKSTTPQLADLLWKPARDSNEEAGKSLWTKPIGSFSKSAAPIELKEADIAASQKAYEELQSEVSKVNAAYIEAERKAVEAKDDDEFDRVQNDLDPRQLIPQKYLDFEQQYRGTPAAFEALNDVVQNARSVGDPISTAAKARVEAINRLIDHYLRHEGIEKTFDGLSGGPRVPRHDEFLLAVLANNKRSHVQVAALVSKLEQTQEILNNQPSIPEMRARYEKHSEDPSGVAILNDLRWYESLDPAQLRHEANLVIDQLKEYHAENISPYGTAADAAKHLSFAINKVIVGELAPEITAATTTGEAFQLSKLRGKPVVLIFTVSREDQNDLMYAPLRKLAADYKGKAEVVMVLSIDRRFHPLEITASKHHFPWTVIPQTLLLEMWPLPPGAKYAKKTPEGGRISCGPLFLDWGILSYPTVYLIDPNGILCPPSQLPYLRGGLGYDTKELAEALDKIVNQQKP